MVDESAGLPGEHALQHAKRRHTPWTEIAKIVNGAVGPESRLGPSQRAAWLRAAARASGYTPAVLRRFGNTLIFVQGFAERSRPDEELIGRSFTAIEMIHRIARQDAEEAARLFGELGRTRMAISDLRRVLKDSRKRRLEIQSSSGRRPVTRAVQSPLPISPPSLASERNWRTDAAIMGLLRLLPELTGKSVHVGRPIGTAPTSVRCDVIAWLSGWTRGDGFEIVHAPAAAARSLVSDRVARSVVASRFFRRFFLTFTPDSSEEHVMRACQALDQLEVRSVGVVLLGAEKPVKRRRTGPPDPDWSHMLPIVCPDGKWNPDFALPRR